MEVGLPVRSAREKAGSRSGILARGGILPALLSSRAVIRLGGRAAVRRVAGQPDSGRGVGVRQIAGIWWAGFSGGDGDPGSGVRGAAR